MSSKESLNLRQRKAALIVHDIPNEDTSTLALNFCENSLSIEVSG
jgi:hypothetical protein